MGRKRLKAVTLAKAPPNRFDLRSEYIGGQPANSAPMEVENPHNPEQKTVVFRSVRDPIASLHSTGQIDEAQYRAGRHWQRAYELSEVGGARAIDPTKEAVDGGRMPEMLTDAQLRAFKDLDQARKALGMVGERIVMAVLGERQTFAIVANRWGLSTDRERRYIGMRFNECLEELAKLWGYAMRGK
jgi:hypothetical protein